MTETQTPHVSIVIPNFNGKELLTDCIDSLHQIDYPHDKYEIILVDNASSDGSMEFVRERYPDVRIVRLDSNHGFVAVNKGIEIAQGEYIVALNNDTKVRADWLIELVTAAGRKGSQHIFTGKTVWMSDPSRVDYAGGKIPINGRGFSARFGELDSPGLSCSHTGYPCAVALLMRRDVFHDLGGFDEDFFACHDDVDLGLRSWIFGHHVYLVPTSIVEHRISATVGPKRSHFSVYHHTKNALQTVIKNFEAKNVLKGLVVSVLYDLLEAGRSLAEANIEAARARVDAYLWVLRHFDRIVWKRRWIQRKRSHPDSILWTMDLYAGLGESLRALRRIADAHLNDRKMGSLQKS